MSYHCKCMSDKECISTLCHGAHYLSHPYYSEEDIKKHTAEQPSDTTNTNEGSKQ